MTNHTLTVQQIAAIEAFQNNRATLIQASAGAGKSSTIKEMLMVAKGSSAVCAFNKAIAQEFEYKIAPLGLQNVKVGTLHSFGFGALRRTIANIKVDANKLRNLARQEFTGQYENLIPFVTSATAMAKESGIGACMENNEENWTNMLDHHDLWDTLPDNVSEAQGIDAAQYLLNRNNELKNIIDFADMLYLPVLFRTKMWQYDNVFLDEAQDTNNTRRELIAMMMKKNGKLVAVGDEHQAIYGFAGADSGSMRSIQTQFNAKVVPLSVSFRCPSAVVKIAQQWVNHIESAPESLTGIVDTCELHEIAKLVSNEDAIICRNTRPLVKLAYSLIRQEIPCRVEGRAIGEGLISLATRWKSVKTVGQLATKLDSWKEKEIEKHQKKENSAKLQALEDQTETLEIFMNQCDSDDSISVLVNRIRSLFSDSNETEKQRVLILTTIHRSKGKEWNRVFALGMSSYSPSKYAKQAWELEQEDNLCYVQVTRAKHHLTLVSVPD